MVRGKSIEKLYKVVAKPLLTSSERRKTDKC